MISIVTITNPWNKEPVVIPLGVRAEREGACLDLVLQAAVAIDVPLIVEVSIRTNGDVMLMGAAWGDHTNTYWHFSRGCEELAGLGSYPNTRPPTEGQRRTLARLWLHLDKLPNGLRSALGGSVCAWAFAGMSPQEISEKYGTGEKVYLTRPCDEHERIIENVSDQDQEDGEIARQEACLENACEEGQIPGAMPAD